VDAVTHLNLSGANGQDDPEAPQQQITTQRGAHCSHSFQLSAPCPWLLCPPVSCFSCLRVSESQRGSEFSAAFCGSSNSSDLDSDSDIVSIAVSV